MRDIDQNNIIIWQNKDLFWPKMAFKWPNFVKISHQKIQIFNFDGQIWSNLYLEVEFDPIRQSNLMVKIWNFEIRMNSSDFVRA